MSKPNLTQQMQQANGARAPEEQPRTVAALLGSPKMKHEIALALPKHMDANRLARIAMTEMRKVPKLAEADPFSFMGALMQCAQLGLEPGGALGHAYLIPFDKRGQVNGKWTVVGTDVQLIVGYRGYLDLARRSGQIMSIEARVIYENDAYDIRFGLDSTLEHQPAWGQDRGKPVFFYAVAKLRDGGTQFEVMDTDEINAIRDASQGYQAAVRNAEKYKKDKVDSPWATHYEEMGKKTVIRRLFKYLPVSIEIQNAVSIDELGDANRDQRMAYTIDAPSFLPNAQLQQEPEGEPDRLSDADIIKHLAERMNSSQDQESLDEVWDSVEPELGRKPNKAENEDLVHAYTKRTEAFKA